MKNRKTISSWLTTRYLLVIRNEENFAEKTSLSFNYSKLIVIAVFTLFLSGTISILLYENSLKQWFFSGETDFELNKRIVELSVAVDSLESAVERKETFINNFKILVDGDSIIDNYYEEPIVDGKNNFDPSEIEFDDPVLDSLLIDEFEAGKSMKLDFGISNKNSLNNLYFFSPIEGLVSRAYNSSIDHFGIDIVSNDNEPIKSIADGTTILSSWTEDAGHVIAVQHKNNIVSIYKHNSELLRKVGNFVRAGEIIAIIGNSGEVTTGPHLHFELWYNGNPVDPEEFINF